MVATAHNLVVIIMDIAEHVSLSSLTTFRVGGPARYLITIHDTQKLPEAVAFAKSKNLPIFTIGGGSNLLISDEPLEAVVIKIIAKGIENGVEYIFDNNSEDCPKCLVVASAGEKWDEVVADTVSRGLGGIENLSLIPGTVGAAPVQNIGAYGSEFSDIVEWVEIFDAEAEIKSQTKTETKEINHIAPAHGLPGFRQ